MKINVNKYNVSQYGHWKITCITDYSKHSRTRNCKKGAEMKGWRSKLTVSNLFQSTQSDNTHCSPWFQYHNNDTWKTNTESFRCSRWNGTLITFSVTRPFSSLLLWMASGSKPSCCKQRKFLPYGLKRQW